MSRRIVTLVGLSPTTRDLAANEPDDGRELWGLNMGHAVLSPQLVSRFTRWFQIHVWDEMVQRQFNGQNHVEWLATCGIPVYLKEERPEVPTGIRYPYEQVVEFLGMDYLTSSPAYMLALALYEGFDEIHLLGIDLATRMEYIHERPCFEWLLGFAQAKGVDIVLPVNCPILKGQPYTQEGISFDRLGDHLKQARESRDKTMAEYNFWQGVVRSLEIVKQEAQEQRLMTINCPIAKPVQSEVVESVDGARAPEDIPELTRR